MPELNHQRRSRLLPYVLALSLLLGGLYGLTGSKLRFGYEGSNIDQAEALLAQAEAQLKLALRSGLTAPADAAQAHKHLAFIYCTSRREALCATAFKAARAADAKFALSKAEAGHPMWSQVYRKALGLK